MIVKCEECKSEFNLDESLIKESGSKVRCSVCKNVFMIYTPVLESFEAVPPEKIFDEDDLEETVALNSSSDEMNVGMTDAHASPDIEENFMGLDLGSSDEKMGDDIFDQIFEDAMEDEEVEEVELDEPDDSFEAGILDEEIPEIESGVEEEIIPLRKKSKKSLLLIILFLIVFFLISGAVLYLYLPDYVPDFLTSPATPETLIETIDSGALGIVINETLTSGDLFDSVRNGSLFVIKGSIVNESSEKKSFVRLKGVIYGDNGIELCSKMAYAGNVFTDEQLNNYSIEEINIEMENRLGKGEINVDIQPHQEIPFIIVLDNLPDISLMSEFEVELVSSS